MPIDTTLKTAADGLLSPKSAALGIAFSSGGRGPLATLTRDGRSMSLTWPSPLPAPEVEGDSATYPEIMPGVDLKLRASASGFSQLLIVKTAKAAANPALKSVGLKLSTNGVTLSSDKRGNLIAVDPAGQKVFTAPTPLMWDSSGASPAGPSARAGTSAASRMGAFEPSHGAKQSAMPVSVTPGKLTLTPDRSLLTGAKTTYPVYIDPSFGGVMQAWTIAYKGSKNQNFYNGAGWRNPDGSTGTDLARVGYEDWTDGLSRSYFGMKTTGLRDKQVISSTFRIKNTWSYSCTPRTVEVGLTGAISTSTTWNNQPTWIRTLDSVNDSKGWGSSCPAGNLAFDVTSAARDAAAKRWTNITLGMRVPASLEGDRLGWKKFAATSAVMSTEYNSRPAAPSALGTIPSSGGCDTAAPYTSIGNTDVYLTAKVSDPDGGTVRAQFRLWGSNDLSGGAQIFNQVVYATSGTVAKAKVPKETLVKYLAAARGNYAWMVQTLDSSSTSVWVPVGATCRFDFDPTRPSTPPGIASTDFPDGSDGWPAATGRSRTPGVFKLTNGGVTDVKSYEYWTDWDATVRPAALKKTTIKEEIDADLAELTLTPPAAGSMRLFVRSVDGAGNRSDRADHLFYANGPATPDKPGDLNGDGNADFYGVRGDSGELWLYTGHGNGRVGTYTVVSNTNFDGASITHRGDWTGDGYEDLVAAVPGERGKSLHVFPNNGFGWACTARNEAADGASRSCLYDEQDLEVYDPANNHWANAEQVLAIGDVDGPLDTNGDGTPDVRGFPDLLVKEGDLLWLYFGSDDFRLDSRRPPVLVGTSWTNYNLAAPGDRDGNGRVDLVARHKITGDLRLYSGTGPSGEGLGDGPASVVIGRSWTAANRPLLTAVPDADGDGKADLWATGGDSKLYSYSDLSGSGVVVGIGSWSNFQALS
ncbi:FG-GAP-like repeat-containing protein [Streptomyces purpureus]|uniref:FG-GAP-like repeat-containing protein n=1 Tax=Streptomyces purpureus TaxID=1951 RepID=UPI001E5D4CCF|nr:FG-GAP-like repeat-containing protein [Streptomyces purpureus]